MKIQIGKRYVTRCGLVTSKMKANQPSFKDDYPFIATVGNNTYPSTFCENGRYWQNGETGNYDLIKEYRPSFWNPNRIWSILFIALCMLIGGAINSLIYEKQRNAWYETQRSEWQERMSALEHTQRQADSVLNEAREVAREIKNK